MVHVVPAFWRAHWCRWSGLRGIRTCRRLALVLWSCVPLLLSAPSLCLCWAVLEICLYSRFNGVFSGFPLLDVGLYCLRALRGLWGFCVREWLGGYMIWCVFAPVLFFCLLFYSFALGFILLPCLSAFRLSSSVCPLCLPCLFLCPCGSCRCFFFPFGLYAKRKGAKVLPVASSLVLLCVFRCLYSY